jgi:hypothetical protein
MARAEIFLAMLDAGSEKEKSDLLVAPFTTV